MTIEDLIKSGAVVEHKTGGGMTGGAGGRSCTVARALTDEEKKVWEEYKDGVRRGKVK